jgi:hypothetical protein
MLNQVVDIQPLVLRAEPSGQTPGRQPGPVVTKHYPRADQWNVSWDISPATVEPIPALETANIRPDIRTPAGETISAKPRVPLRPSPFHLPGALIVPRVVTRVEVAPEGGESVTNSPILVAPASAGRTRGNRAPPPGPGSATALQARMDEVQQHITALAKTEQREAAKLRGLLRQGQRDLEMLTGLDTQPEDWAVEIAEQVGRDLDVVRKWLEQRQGLAAADRDWLLEEPRRVLLAYDPDKGRFLSREVRTLEKFGELPGMEGARTVDARRSTVAHHDFHVGDRDWSVKGDFTEIKHQPTEIKRLLLEEVRQERNLLVDFNEREIDIGVQQDVMRTVTQVANRINAGGPLDEASLHRLGINDDALIGGMRETVAARAARRAAREEVPDIRVHFAYWDEATGKERVE